MSARAAGRLAMLVFVAVWAGRSVLASGSVAVSDQTVNAWRSSPASNQQNVGDALLNALAFAGATLPADDTVLVVMTAAQRSNDYYYYWTTLWLHPRALTITTDTGSVRTPGTDTVIYVEAAGQAKVQPPPAYELMHIETSPDGASVTIYRRHA